MNATQLGKSCQTRCICFIFALNYAIMPNSNCRPLQVSAPEESQTRQREYTWILLPTARGDLNQMQSVSAISLDIYLISRNCNLVWLDA